ncbi:MAG: hypothetical protein IJA85_01350 [Clostridia bacterium]|nr:hypothetical protein [Clostridia bacterium]
MGTLNQFKLCKFGPYRFIGKSVYARAGKSGNIFGYMWSNKWIFEELDKLSEYSTDEKHNSALLTWEWYNSEGIPHFDIFCGPSKLLGYTVGRFMKPDTPVPEGMDYFDIPETYVAKGWFDKEEGNEEAAVKQAVSEHDGYTAASWRFMVEVEAENAFGYYIACDCK